MRNTIYLATAAICLIGLAAPRCTGADSLADRKQINALFSKLQSAMASKNLDGVIATESPDMAYIENGRPVNKAQFAKLMKQEFSMMVGAPKSRITIVSCDIRGAKATVLSAHHTEAMITGKDHKTHDLVSDSSVKELVVKTDKGWFMKIVDVMSSKMTWDGQNVLNKKGNSTR